MCAICGMPDPTHEQLIVRTALLVGGSGSLFVPRAWLARALRTLRGALSF